MKRDEIWARIIEVHQYAKELMIKGEEIGSAFEYETFIQPLQEQRHALEHIVRARYSELNPENDEDDKYIEQNLEKALGHEYRCFFDIADWVSITIRDSIIRQLSKYSSDCISFVFPDYYEKIRPLLEKISQVLKVL